MKKCSDKSYAYAVCLSSIFGFIGIQHFYMGRYLEGLSRCLVNLSLGLLLLFRRQCGIGGYRLGSGSNSHLHRYYHAVNGEF